MLQHLKKLKQLRTVLLERTKHLTMEQYNFIPAGSKNNIIWNMGHILVTSDGLFYQNSPQLRLTDENLRVNYQMGSKPSEQVDRNDIARIRLLLQQTPEIYQQHATPDRTEDVFAALRDTGLVPIGDGEMQFLLFHEEMHLQKIMNMLGTLGIEENDQE